MKSCNPYKLARAGMVALAGISLALAGCGSSDPKSQGGGPGGRGPKGPVTVGYVIVQQGSAPVMQDLPGRVAAFQVSDVRPQVSGVILRRLFREGSFVRQGQTLYQIDPSLYKAQAAQAPANLQSARARPKPRGPAPHDTGRSSNRRRSPSRIIRTRWPRRGRPMRPSRRTPRRPKRADQPALHPRPGADHRPDRPVERHRRRAGHRQPGGCPDDDHAARSGLCRHPAVGGRPARAAASRWRRAAPSPTTAQVRLKLPDGSIMATPAPSSSAEVLVDQAPAP